MAVSAQPMSWRSHGRFSAWTVDRAGVFVLPSAAFRRAVHAIGIDSQTFGQMGEVMRGAWIRDDTCQL